MVSLTVRELACNQNTEVSAYNESSTLLSHSCLSDTLSFFPLNIFRRLSHSLVSTYVVFGFALRKEGKEIFQHGDKPVRPPKKPSSLHSSTSLLEMRIFLSCFQ